jgi:hypothetical protein
MKFVEPSPFTDPDAASRKLVEIVNASEAVQDGLGDVREGKNPPARTGALTSPRPDAPTCKA